MAVDFNFLRFRLNPPNWALVFESLVRHIGSDAGVGFLNRVGRLIVPVTLVQGSAFAWLQSNMPCHFRLGVGASGRLCMY